MRRETRFRYEPIDEVPDGWRWLRNEFNDDGFFALWTEAPEGESAHGRQSKWITLRQVVQERFVTEWSDTVETSTHRAPADGEEAVLALRAGVLERDMTGVPGGPEGWHSCMLSESHVRQGLGKFRVPVEWKP